MVSFFGSATRMVSPSVTMSRSASDQIRTVFHSPMTHASPKRTKIVPLQDSLFFSSKKKDEIVCRSWQNPVPNQLSPITSSSFIIFHRLVLLIYFHHWRMKLFISRSNGKLLFKINRILKKLRANNFINGNAHLCLIIRWAFLQGLVHFAIVLTLLSHILLCFVIIHQIHLTWVSWFFALSLLRLCFELTLIWVECLFQQWPRTLFQ